MPESIGYQFTTDDRQLIAALNRFEHGLEDIRAEAKKLSVDTGKAFSQITRQMGEAEKKSFGFKKLFSGLIAVDVVRAGVQAVKQIGQAAIGAAGNYEQLQVAFGTFLGSAEKADKLLKELTQTAATTPFQQDEIFGAARQLLAFGIEQERVNDLIRDLGDISSGVGQPLSRLTLIFGQIQSKGKLVGQELLQLREAGVNPIEELAEVTGFAAHEIENMASKGRITADHVAAAFKLMTSEGGRFNNLMEKQSETFQGLTSNFKDQISIVLREFGTGLLPVLKDGIQNMLQFLKTLDPEKIRNFARNLGEFFSILGSLLKQLPFLIAGYLAYQVAVNYAAIATKALTVAQKAFNAASKANPIGLLLAGVTALIPQLITLGKRIGGITKVMEEMKGKVRDIKSEIIDESLAIDENIKVLGSLNSTAKQRQAALDTLKATYPDILAAYGDEITETQTLIELQKKLKDALLERIRVERKGEATKEFVKQLEDAKAAEVSFFLGSKAAREENTKNLRKNLEEQAKAQFEETINIIDQAVDAAGKIVQTADLGLASTEERVKSHKEEEAITRQLLSLTTAQLRELVKSKDVDDKRKALATEIIKAREAEARANAGNKKEIEKAAKALEKYQETLKKVADDIEKAGIDQISNPFKKIQAEQQLALDQTKTLFDELRKEAREVGQDITQINDLEAQARNQINVEYYLKLDELRKEDREKQLAEFISQQQLLASLRNTQIAQTTSSDGINTKDELVRKKILEAELNDLRLLLNNRNATANELLQIQADFNAKQAELDQVNLQNRQAVIDRAEQHALAEVDLIEKSGDLTLSLEEFKEKKRLEVQLAFAQKRLDILKIESGANSPEVRQLEDTIAAYNNALSHIGEGTIIDNIKKKIADLFKIDVGTLNESLSQLGSIFSGIQGLVSDNTQFQIEQQQELLDATRERISETESDLEREIEDQRKGYAANIEGKKAELLSLREQEAQHKKELAKQQKAALKQQLLSDSLTQVSSLITMAANVPKATSILGPAGIPIALATIAAFLTIFRAFKATAKAQAGLEKGGRIPKEGYTDKGGRRGHRVEGTNIVVGAGEHVINADSSERHNDFLKDLNSGKYDHLNLNDTLEPFRLQRFRPLGKEISDRINKKREAAIEKKNDYEHRLRKEVMKDVFKGEIDRLIQYFDNKGESMPWLENQIGIIEKKKNRTTRTKFSE